MLKDYIAAYVAAKFDRWHTPGHKGTLLPGDITELIDGRYFPEDCVTAAEAACAKVFGVKYLRFLSGGSSMGVKAAILAAGGDVLTGANNHPSVSEGLRLAGKKAVVVQNKTANGLPKPLSPEQIDRGLKENPGVAAVLVLSPDYYGQCALAGEVAAVVKSHKKLLIADSAHGAHFAVDETLFPLSFIQKADAVNLSAHKTLNAFTQSAYLCVNNENLKPKIDEALTLLGTTSPSYVLFSQLEEAALTLKAKETVTNYRALKGRCDAFKKAVPCLPNGDFTRIVIDAAAFGTTAETLTEHLLANRIMPEKSGDGYVVLIATPFDGQAQFDRLLLAVQSAPKTAAKKRNR